MTSLIYDLAERERERDRICEVTEVLARVEERRIRRNIND